MKIFFPSRSKARNFKNSSSIASRLIDSKSNPSKKGSRWAVEVDMKRRKS